MFLLQWVPVDLIPMPGSGVLERVMCKFVLQ